MVRHVPTDPGYAELAKRLHADLIAVEESIPQGKTTKTMNAKFINAHQSVPGEFIRLLAHILTPEEDGKVSRSVFDPDDARNVLQFVDAFRSVTNEAALLTKLLQAAVKTEYARIAANALDAWAIMQRLARSGDPAMKRYIKALRRDLGLQRKKKAAAKKKRAAKKAAAKAATKA